MRKTKTAGPFEEAEEEYMNLFKWLEASVWEVIINFSSVPLNKQITVFLSDI